MSRSFDKRTRTGYGVCKGGLGGDLYQHWMVTLLHPKVHEGEFRNMKIEISSNVKEKDEESQSKEYMSLRFENMTAAKTFLISFLLSLREYAKYSPDESAKDLKTYLQRITQLINEGHFDDRIKVYGYTGEQQ